MDAGKRKRLESQGWKIGTAEEFLGLTPEESASVKLEVALNRIHPSFRKWAKAYQSTNKRFGNTLKDLAK